MRVWAVARLLIKVSLALSCSASLLEAQHRAPVIDMHMHAREAAHY